MYIGNPYELDHVHWPLMDPEDRWILNKMDMLLKLGVEAGPCGTFAPKGDICIRPLMNLFGNAGGGFFKVAHPGGRVRNRPGYFWTPWVDGPHTWTFYLLDIPQWAALVTLQDDDRATVEELLVGLHPVPTQLLGISRYLGIERIGNTLIEVSPRHAHQEGRQNIIDDYAIQNPNWDKLDLDGKPFVTNRVIGLKRVDYGQDEWGLVGWRWDQDYSTWITV